MPDDSLQESRSPLSLKRLTAAFAQMLGSPGVGGESDTSPQRDPCEISPRSIVEAVLFVGAEDNQPRTAEELAAGMRDVSAEEVVAAIGQLNELYERDAAPYRVVQRDGGYLLELREELHRLRDNLHGRTKEAKLSPAALEVLSVVAYQQPTTAVTIDGMRGKRSGALLSALVRRGLVRLDRPAENPDQPHYHTTDRFLRLFGLAHIDQLPRAAEMDD